MGETKVAIETINNKLVTIVRKCFDAEWVKEQLDMGIPVVCELYNMTSKRITLIKYTEDLNYPWVGCYLNIAKDIKDTKDLTSIITILPALPQHPKSEDAALLYRYWSEGLAVRGLINDIFSNEKEEAAILPPMYDAQITHATHNGERVKIAINKSTGESDE